MELARGGGGEPGRGSDVMEEDGEKRGVQQCARCLGRGQEGPLVSLGDLQRYSVVRTEWSLCAAGVRGIQGLPSLSSPVPAEPHSLSMLQGTARTWPRPPRACTPAAESLWVLRVTAG